MKTIHKLVLKAYIGPMVVTFFIVMFVLMMNFVWRYIEDLVGKGLDFGIIVEVMCYAMINMIPMGLPLVMLLAAIMAMGNLGENYEILAMKSAGMSLLQIMKPLIILTGFVSIGSFFIINDLVPYANLKLYSTLSDISRQNKALEFKDGLFFTGIDNMKIRVEKQDKETKLLHNVLIYDNRKTNGDMTTTLADSGYIYLSDSKKYLIVSLYNGETYEQRRSGLWYRQSTLRHHIFEKQDLLIPMSGFAMTRSDESMWSSQSTTKNIVDLQADIDSMEIVVSNATTDSYGPLLRDNIFIQDKEVLELIDSLVVDKTGFRGVNILDSLPNLDTRAMDKLLDNARSAARNSRNMFAFDESKSKNALVKLYNSKVEWHNKLVLPISIIIFFLIGAPLGAIIRKGGFGLPIVISVTFFIFYYIISITTTKLAKEGTWEAIYAMWFSSAILAPIAAYLTVKATNDSSLLDTDWYRAKFKIISERLMRYTIIERTVTLVGRLSSKLKFIRKKSK